MSLGHAMFFASGLYGAGLTVYYWGFGAVSAFAFGVGATFVLAAIFGLIVIRTTGVSFLIVTLMFAQAAFLTTLYFNRVTRGDEGIVISSQLRPLEIGSSAFPFADPSMKYNVAWLVFAVSFIAAMALVRSPIGRIWVAIRENEARTRMLGYNTYKYKFLALVVSATIAVPRAPRTLCCFPISARRLRRSSIRSSRCCGRWSAAWELSLGRYWEPA